MGVPLQSLRRIKIIMKRRKMHAWGLLMVGLIMSSHINSGFAGRTYAQTAKEQIQEQQSHRQQHDTTNDVASYRNLQQLQQPATARQARQDSSLITTLISLGLKYGPTLFNLAFGGEGGSSVPDKSTDKVDDLEIKEEDPLSTSNLISMAIKVALALFSSATSGGIDKSDVNTTQSILGIVISALTGSEDPSEVAVMAKQASEVVNMLISLVEALQTSFSSS